jgi:hypothetical protein
MIQCQICKKMFKSIITFSHLKSHGVSTEEYKSSYGEDSLSTKEYKLEKAKSSSINNKGRIAWNKNKKIGSSENFKAAIRLREQKYNSGELQRRKYEQLDEETKQKISKSISLYAENNPDELSNRAHKAIETKKQKGIDIAFFRGKTHTEHNKKLFSRIFQISRNQRIENSYERILSKIKSINLSLLNDISNKDLQLKCNICAHEFTFTKQYFHDCKFHDKLCPNCYPRSIQTSKAQLEIYEYIKKYFENTILNYNTEYGDIDIFIPELNLGIEYNGLYWHSVEILQYNNKSKLKDYEKYNNLKDKYRIICILEDEWVYKKHIVIGRLNHILGLTKNKLYGRKCIIKNIDSKTANQFFENNHIQGSCKANCYFGAYYDEELVAAISFSTSNLSRKINGQWEISRFCSKIDYNVIGIAHKMFKHFIKLYNPESVISYADSRWSDGNLYKTIGFEFVRQTVPNYWYFKPNELKRIHRFTLRKTKEDPVHLTEKQLRFNEGYYSIYDYGSSKWIWNKL